MQLKILELQWLFRKSTTGLLSDGDESSPMKFGRNARRSLEADLEQALRKKEKTFWIHGQDFLVALKAGKNDNCRGIFEAQLPAPRGRISGVKIRCAHCADEQSTRGLHRDPAGAVLLGAQALQDPPEGEPSVY